MSSMSKLKYFVVIVILLFVASLFVVHAWWAHRGPQPGTVLDEARRANRPAWSRATTPADFSTTASTGRPIAHPTCSPKWESASETRC